MDWSGLRGSRAAWEEIAESFDRTRHRPWPPAVEFLRRLPRGSMVFDAGGGNGRHTRAGHELGHRMVAFDVSQRLLQLGRARTRPSPATPAWVVGAVELPPLLPGRFDAGLALAVLHHVRGRPARRQAVEELTRLLRPGGLLLISVWNRHQPAFEDPRKPLRPPSQGLVEPGDAMLQWTQHGLNAERFIHLYEFDEFRAELEGLSVVPEKIWEERLRSTTRPDNFFARFRVPSPAQG